jgi:3-oxoacyl-[acyl-carrier-protein] synthase II
MIGNIASGTLAIRYGMRGECLDIVSACSTGSHSIGTAMRDIRHGYIDVALAGGTEEAVSPICLAGFVNLGALSRESDPTQASRPFDARRNGFVSGEGAGVLVLESLEHARQRGATVLAEVVGFGSTCDAYHMTAPDPHAESLARAMAKALQEGGFELSDVGHLNAHGTGTEANDRSESMAVRALFGEELGSCLPVTSVKGSIGHGLGAAGAIEAIVCARSVASDCIPPTTGFAVPDPECPVNVVTEAIHDRPQRVALSTNLGFGGHNAALAIAPIR